MLGALVLAVRFACELAALASLAWWGADESGIALAITTPVVAATLWGTLVAPRARHRLRDPWRFAAESVVWAGAIAALVALDRPALAAALGLLAITTAIAARRFEPDLVRADR